MNTTTTSRSAAQPGAATKKRARFAASPVARLLKLPEVIARCQVGKSFIYAGMAANTFPKCRPLPGSRAVVWVPSEIDAWTDAVASGRAWVAPPDKASQGAAR